MAIVDFLQTTPGRYVRGIVGLVLIVLGISLGGWWWLLALIGLVPLTAALLNTCVLARVLGASQHDRH